MLTPTMGFGRIRRLGSKVPSLTRCNKQYLFGGHAPAPVLDKYSEWRAREAHVVFDEAPV